MCLGSNSEDDESSSVSSEINICSANKREDDESSSVSSQIFYMLELITFTNGIILLCVALFTSCYDEYVCYRNLMLGSFVFAVCFCILVLTHTGKFSYLVNGIQRIEFKGLKLQTLILGLFLVLGLIDFFLLSISVACEEGDIECDEPLLNPDSGNGEVRHVTRTLTAVCAILFVLTVLAYWDHFSYISAHNAWVQAILYCTIVGGVFLEVARCLVKPVKMDSKDDLEKPDWS